MQEMANSIRALRLEHHMTQAQLAKELGVQYQTVSKWETGVGVPDTAMLPRIADFFDIPLDRLFGRRHTGCGGVLPESDREFLLRTYAQMYGPEAGPWNLSVENLYLMYKITDFFEKHFSVGENTQICNIGIGAGEWDRYLSYKLKKGTLTSIDREEVCCRQLEQRLLCEENPNDVRVICADAMALHLDGRFDIVTVVGSTVAESGTGLSLLRKAMGFLRPGGALYYQSLDEKEDCNGVIRTAFQQGMDLGAFCRDDAYGFCCHYYRFEKRK